MVLPELVLAEPVQIPVLAQTQTQLPALVRVQAEAPAQAAILTQVKTLAATEHSAAVKQISGSTMAQHQQTTYRMHRK